MTPRRPLIARLLAVLVVVWLAVPGTRVMGQLTPDPYNIVGEGNGQYESFMYANQPNASSMFPNQAVLQQARAAYRGANRFQNYVERLDGGLPESNRPDLGRRPGAGTPYYQANRPYDQDFKRQYRPNQDVDSTFYKDQETQVSRFREEEQGKSDRRARDAKYQQVIQEKDPKKRSQLLREYNFLSLLQARKRAPSPVPTASDILNESEDLDRGAPAITPRPPALAPRPPASSGLAPIPSPRERSRHRLLPDLTRPPGLPGALDPDR